MKKHRLQMSERERRKWIKRFRQMAILAWFSVILFTGMGYVLLPMLWDSPLAAVTGALSMIAFWLLKNFVIFPHWRRVHVETWRLLRKKLPLDTLD